MSLTITTIPTELIGEIASHLSDLDHSALRMTCKSMHSKIGTARILGEDDYHFWHKQYESYHRRHTCPALLLLCTSCMEHLPRTSFQDSKSHKTCDGARVCVECAITIGMYDNHYFRWKGTKKFYCNGCEKIKPVKNSAGFPNEGAYITDRSRAKARAELFHTTPTRVFTAEKKWCGPCWQAVKSWRSAKVKFASKIEADKVRRRGQRVARRAAAAAALAQAVVDAAAVATGDDI